MDGKQAPSDGDHSGGVFDEWTIPISSEDFRSVSVRLQGCGSQYGKSRLPSNSQDHAHPQAPDSRPRKNNKSNLCLTSRRAQTKRQFRFTWNRKGAQSRSCGRPRSSCPLGTAQEQTRRVSCTGSRYPAWSSAQSTCCSMLMKAFLFWCVLVVGRPRSARAPGRALTSKKHGPVASLSRTRAELTSSPVVTVSTKL